MSLLSVGARIGGSMGGWVNERESLEWIGTGTVLRGLDDSPCSSLLWLDFVRPLCQIFSANELALLIERSVFFEDTDEG